MSQTQLSKELAAMVALEHALQDLNEEELRRVVGWAASRFGVAVPRAAPPARGAAGDGGDENAGDGRALSSDQASSLAEFFDSASPGSEAEKVLVVGYWLQYREGLSELESQKINSELKHLGYGIGNVTRALEWHKSQKPVLMRQTRKEGNTRQARKKWSVTNEGKKHVERMIAGNS